MITINANTKIGTILKQHPGALDAIVSISPKFEKLRNPVLRKLMAGRASIAMASKIGGCSITDFFNKLKPLGFAVDKEKVPAEKEMVNEKPDYLINISTGQIITLDVRPVIEGGKDPLNLILEKIKSLQAGQVLQIINSFEPTPLMFLLKKQGFESYAEIINDNLVQTYFYKAFDAAPAETSSKETSAAGWDETVQRFEGKLQTTDVRQMGMPQPMLTILEALDNLPADGALFVYHKRIPVFLLPELAERKFDYRIKEISEGEVQLLIFKS
ncbi:MAG: DUF2249 domain-containing protein [Sphingobacteriales bacterium]|nr:DUF2249 domain-containing protein [Sphingobacteriales bacterium]